MQKEIMKKAYMICDTMDDRANSDDMPRIGIEHLGSCRGRIVDAEGNVLYCQTSSTLGFLRLDLPRGISLSEYEIVDLIGKDIPEKFRLGPKVRPKILIDCDGILSDLASPLLSIVSSMRGKKVSVSDFSVWNWFDALSADELSRVSEEMIKPGWCYSLEVLPGVEEALEALHSMVDVYCVTQPHDSLTWAYERAHWLEDRLHIPRRNVISASDKSVITGRFFLDDNPSNVVLWREANPMGVPMLWDYPNTASCGLNLYRVRNWEGVISTVTQVLGV